MKWIKNNWLLLILIVLVIILIFSKSCNESAYREDITELDDEITELKSKNLKLEDQVLKEKTSAEIAQKVVAEKEIIIIEAKLRIKSLEKEEIEIVTVVTELLPSALVEETREILECAEVTLRDDGVLFSIECARRNLINNKQFSLVRKQLDETVFALSQSEEATQFQKMATWYVYRIAWAQASQILNYKEIGKKQDIKFTKSERQRKKSFLSGFMKGLVIGSCVTITIVLVIPFIRTLI